MTGSSRERARQAVRIARFFKERHRRLEEEGDGPYRPTALGVWAVSRAPHLYYFFKTFNLERRRFFVDLGCGDGLVACMAALFTRAAGVEVDAGLCRAARRAARSLSLPRPPEFVQADYLSMVVRRADCLYLYPDKPFPRLEEILPGWPGDLLVYGPHVPPRHLLAVRRLQCGPESMVVYSGRKPAMTSTTRSCSSGLR